MSWNLLPPWYESLYLQHTKWCCVNMWRTGVYSGLDQGENLRWKSQALCRGCFGTWPVCQFCYLPMKLKGKWRQCSFTTHNTALKSFFFWLMYFKQLNIFSINFTAFHLPLNRSQWGEVFRRLWAITEWTVGKVLLWLPSSVYWWKNYYNLIVKCWKMILFTI